ncbi:MAG TPA: DNA-3-methyladenine glycosylase I [Candidatus Acidoferrales bacterium]|nr:DNA-3-methyladenine glycosylase I [Candidatus Acidoferrales bacterium]
MPKRLVRCPWARNEPELTYHDREWGIPLHDDRKLFEMLVLEGAQAGLSWDTILRKRDRYREVFAGFDPAKVGRFTSKRVEIILRDPGIVRNRAKVEAAVTNAKAFLAVQTEFGSFDEFVWRVVGGAPVLNAWRKREDVPASTPQSEAMSRDLRARGFRFVGPTICYAFMQAVGMVNDHLVSCAWRRGSIASNSSG